jgi:tRNA-2-methylthio-N6-dimethylallyladenosine synthase
MGRGYTVSEYSNLVDSLRAARPDIALSTDLIVGFPGESDEEFNATLALVEATRFSSVFAFKYSPRPGTAAPKLGPPVDEQLANERLQKLLARQQEIQRTLNGKLEGEIRDVLVTGMGRKPGMLTGRTSCHRIVHFAINGQSTPLGSLATVRIEQALPNSLLGTLAEGAAT